MTSGRNFFPPLLKFFDLFKMVSRNPLSGSSRVFCLNPIKRVQATKILIRKFNWVGSPNAFKTTCYSIGIDTTFIFQPKRCSSSLAPAGTTSTHFRNIFSVGFTKRVTTDNQSHCFFIVQVHATKGFANVFGGSERIRFVIMYL